MLLFVAFNIRTLNLYFDSFQFITEDTSTLKLFRRINLPEYVSLEESLSIRLFLLSETEHFFRPLIETDEAADSEVSNIVSFSLSVGDNSVLMHYNYIVFNKITMTM